MSNASDLLRKLTSPEKDFKISYEIFIKQCANSYAQIDDIKHTKEIENVLSLLRNKYTVPLLIEKFLTKGSVSFHECNLLLYNQLYKNNNEMLLSYTDILENPKLKETYLENGADISAFVITTAQHWEIQQESNVDLGGLCFCQNQTN
jgi:hypothetical protein